MGFNVSIQLHGAAIKRVFAAVRTDYDFLIERTLLNSSLRLTADELFRYDSEGA
jgi:hypothetical protein